MTHAIPAPTPFPFPAAEATATATLSSMVPIHVHVASTKASTGMVRLTGSTLPHSVRSQCMIHAADRGCTAAGGKPVIRSL